MIMTHGKDAQHAPPLQTFRNFARYQGDLHDSRGAGVHGVEHDCHIAECQASTQKEKRGNFRLDVEDPTRVHIRRRRAEPYMPSAVMSKTT